MYAEYYDYMAMADREAAEAAARERKAEMEEAFMREMRGVMPGMSEADYKMARRMYRKAMDAEMDNAE